MAFLLICRINEVSSFGVAFPNMIKLVVTGDDSQIFQVSKLIIALNLTSISNGSGSAVSTLTLSTLQNAVHHGQPFYLNEVLIANVFRYLGTLIVFFVLRTFILCSILIAYVSLKAYSMHMPSVQNVSARGTPGSSLVKQSDEIMAVSQLL